MSNAVRRMFAIGVCVTLGSVGVALGTELVTRGRSVPGGVALAGGGFFLLSAVGLWNDGRRGMRR